MERLFAMALACLLCCSSMAADYYLTGSTAAYDGSSAGIFASYWGAANGEDLLQDNGDGTYARTYVNVPVGVYAFQVIKDGDWSTVIKDGSSNFFIDVVEACDVEVVLDVNGGNKVTVSGLGLRQESPAEAVALTVVWNDPDVKVNVYGSNWAPLTDWPGEDGSMDVVHGVECVAFTVDVPKGSQVHVIFTKGDAQSADVALGLINESQSVEFSVSADLLVSSGIAKPTVVAAPKKKAAQGSLFTLTGAPAPANAHGMLIQNGRVVFR